MSIDQGNSDPQNTSVDTTDTDPNELDTEIENLTVDSLLSVDESKFPEFASTTIHKVAKPLDQWLQHVPEDMRKHLANVRADYTRKTQQLADQRKALEVKEAELLQQQQRLMQGPLAEQLKNIDTETKHDLFDADGMKAEIERQAKLLLKQMMEPAQKELEVKERRMQLQKFAQENPELNDPAYRPEIMELLKTRPELKVEDALMIVKGKKQTEAAMNERAALAANKKAKADVLRHSATGSTQTPTGPKKFANAVEAYEYHKALQNKK